MSDEPLDRRNDNDSPEPIRLPSAEEAFQADPEKFLTQLADDIDNLWRAGMDNEAAARKIEFIEYSARLQNQETPLDEEGHTPLHEEAVAADPFATLETIDVERKGSTSDLASTFGEGFDDEEFDLASLGQTQTQELALER